MAIPGKKTLFVWVFVAAHFLSRLSSHADAVVENCNEADLRAAIQAGGRISFGCDGVISLSETLSIETTVEIDGGDRQVTIDGRSEIKLFSVNDAGLTLKNLELINGKYHPSGLEIPPELAMGAAITASNSTLVLEGCGFSNHVSILGGAVYAYGGTVLVEDCRFVNNSAVGHWSGYPARGGAMYLTQAPATIRNSLVLTNSAILGRGATQGGAIYSDGSLLVTNSVFRKNGIRGFGATAEGGAIYSSGDLTLSGSSFTQNTAGTYDLNGSGQYASGGAIFSAGSLEVMNCSFIHNGTKPGSPRYSNSGRIESSGGAISTATGSGAIRYSTIALNTLAANPDDPNVRLGGGIRNAGAEALELKAVILSANQHENLSGVFLDSGHNISSDNTGNLAAPSSRTNADPYLGLPVEIGGHTVAPLRPSSPARNGADEQDHPELDQLGIARDHEGAPDIGAVEFGAGLARDLLISVNSAMDTNAVVEAGSPASVRIYSLLPEATVFYTLDGTEPSPTTHVYTGPFQVWSNAVIRAVVYDSDFQRSEPPAVRVTFESVPRLHVRSIGPGRVEVNPAKDVYTLGEEVQLTAVPDPYSTLVRWLDRQTEPSRTILIGESNSYVAIFTNIVDLDEQFYLEWERNLFGVGPRLVSIKNDEDDFMLAGSSRASAREWPGVGGIDFRMVRLSEDGEVLWDRGFGNAETSGEGERPASLVRHDNDSFLISGTSAYAEPPNGTKSSAAFGGTDLWVVRIGEDGSQMWEKSFGGEQDERGGFLVEAHDGGYFLAGQSASGATGNKLEPAPGWWMVKLDPDGNKTFEQVVTPPKTNAILQDLVRTSGGYLLSGRQETHARVLVGLNESGMAIWEKIYLEASEGNEVPEVTKIIPTPDGGYYEMWFIQGKWRSVLARRDAQGEELWVELVDSTKLADGVLDEIGGIYVMGLYYPPFPGSKPHSRVVHFDAQGGQMAENAWGFNDPFPNSIVFAATKLARTENGLLMGGYKLGRAYSALWATKLKEYRLPPGTPRVLVDGEMKLMHAFTNRASAVVQMNSSIPGASIFYTMDGSTNFEGAMRYSSPISITKSMVIRAIARSGDYISAASPAIEIHLEPMLTLDSSAGGRIVTAPPGTNFPPDTVVHLSAEPDEGWQFIGWEGDATGSTPEIELVMDEAKEVRAVFGTTLSLSSSGGGEIQPVPNLPLFPYGTEVTLLARPDEGYYFGLWGEEANASTNNLRLTVTGPTEVSALFLPVPEEQMALTALANGRGTVSVDPAGKVYTAGQEVILRALPEAGSTFLGWTGDLVSGSPEVALTLTDHMVLYANFSGGDPGRLGETAYFSGIGLSASGELELEVATASTEFRLESSADLINWQEVNVYTNSMGSMRLSLPPSDRHRFFRVRVGQ